jgi:hypothetical protein
MLLLLTDSLLLLFITLSLGIFTHHILEKVFRVPVQTDLLGIFLLGIVASSFYFNVLSFWWPVNYFSLIPLAALSLLTGLLLPEKLRQIGNSIGDGLQFLFAPSRLFITGCVIATLLFYWIIPPGNPDSWDYHYLSIRWYEQYKVVPGLANIHGRFAFNTASFIIQAAYSFTGPAGQSLYPLNGVLLALFFFWLLVRMFHAKNSMLMLLYGSLIFMLFKPLLINISSPSSDTLAAVCISYALISLFRLQLDGEEKLSLVLAPCLIILYALTAKLSTFPVLLVLPFIFFLLPEKERKTTLLLRVSMIALLIFLPWLGRNYILSGYLIYPLPYLDLFHPDWKAPVNILKIDVYEISTYSKIGHRSVPFSAPLPLTRWFLPWFKGFFERNTPFDAIFFIVAMLSPLFWIVPFRKSGKNNIRPFGLWLIVYAGVWIWFLTSPVLRFGAVFLSLSIIFPALAFFSRKPPERAGPILLQLYFTCAVIYYIASGYAMPSTYPFALADCWLRPLKDIHYSDIQKVDFPYTILRSGVKLYLSDADHACINTDLPCAHGLYGEIEMRGNTIAEGFRLKKDETLIHYPYIR